MHMHIFPIVFNVCVFVHDIEDGGGGGGDEKWKEEYEAMTKQKMEEQMREVCVHACVCGSYVFVCITSDAHRRHALSLALPLSLCVHVSVRVCMSVCMYARSFL